MSSLSVRVAAGGAWVPFGVVAVLALLEGSGTHLYRAAFHPLYLAAFGLAGAGALAVGARTAFLAGPALRDRRCLLALGALLFWLLAWNRSLVASPWPDRAWLEALVPLGATGMGVLAARALALSRDPGAALGAASWALVATGLLVAVRSLTLWIGGTVAPEIALQGTVNEVSSTVTALLHAPWRLVNGYPFGHSNYTAAAALLLLSPAAALAFAERGRRRVPGLLAAALLAATLFTANSRAGFLALGVVLVAAAVLGLTRLPRTPWLRTGLLVAALAAATALVASSARVRTTVALVAQGEWRLAMDPGRAELVRRGWDMGLARPFAGWGAGSTPLVYPALRAADEAPGLAQAHQLHSTPIQLWADHGILGPLAAGLVLLVGAAAWWRGRRTLGSSGRTLADGALLGALGATVFGLTDYALDVPLLAAGPALLLGLAAGPGFHRRALAPPPRATDPAAPSTTVAPATEDAAEERAPTPNRPADRLIRLLGLITSLWLVCFGLLAGLRQALVVVTRSAAHAAVTRSDLPLDERVALWDRAIAGAPTEIGHRHGRATLLTEAALAATDPDRQRSLADRAAAAWDDALAVWPHSELAHFQAGWLRLESDPAAAEAHFRAAARIVPEKTSVHFGLALARRDLADREGMIQAFALEWFCNPANVLLPLWRDPAQVGLRAEIEERLLALHAQADATDPSMSQEARNRRLGRALVRWWLTGTSGEHDRADLARGPRPDHAWLARALDPAADPSEPPPAATLRLAWLAWNGSLPPAPAAAASVRIARREEPPAALATALGNWLAQPDLPFTAQLRSAPADPQLRVTWRATRPAVPLLDRQEGRPAPFDIPELEQEVPALLWVRPLFPNQVRPPPGLHGPWLEP